MRIRLNNAIMVVFTAISLISLQVTAAPKSKYVSPTAITKSGDGKTLYIANHTAGTVYYLDAATCKGTKRIQLEKQLSGITITPDDKMLIVTADSADGEVYLIDVATGKIKTTLRAQNTPMSPRVTPNGKKLYIANRFSNSVSIFDMQTLKLIKHLPVPPREPFSIGISTDSKKILVANLLNGKAVKDYTATGITVIYSTDDKVHKHFVLSNGSTGTHQIAPTPDNKWAYITYTLGRYQLPTTQLERGWMNTNALAIINLEKDGDEKHYNTVLLDDVDLGASNPWAVRVSADNKRIVVTHAGTHEISVIDRIKMHEKLAKVEKGEKVSSVSDEPDDVPNDLSFLVGIRERIKLKGKGPRALELVGSKAYVPEYFSDTMSVVDLDSERFDKVKSYRLGPKVEMDILRKGQMFFNDADLCFQKWQSCASCHPFARPDALNWDLLNDGMGNPKNTKSMLLSHVTPPVMITGVRASAEIAVRAGIKHIQFAVRPEEDAQAIDAWLKSLKPVPSPYLVNGKLSESAKRGKKLFDSDEVGCAQCHSGPYFTDLEKYNVGTGLGLDKDTEFDTPTLVEHWRTSPYLFDGRAENAIEVLTKYNKEDKHGKTSHLNEQQIKDLAEYVLSL